MSYREPEGLDASMVIPELLKMTYTLSYCIKNYDRMHPHAIVEDIKMVHLRGISRVFSYGTNNADFIVRKAHKTGDMRNHLLYCHNCIWQYMNYLTSTSSAGVQVGGNDSKRL